MSGKGPVVYVDTTKFLEDDTEQWPLMVLGLLGPVLEPGVALSRIAVHLPGLACCRPP